MKPIATEQMAATLPLPKVILPALTEAMAGRLIFVLDVLTIIAVFYATFRFRGALGSPSINFLASAGFSVAVVWMAFYAIDAYRTVHRFAALDYAVSHVVAGIIAFTLAFLVIYVFARNGSVFYQSRGSYLVAAVIFLPLSLYYRRMFATWLSQHVGQRCVIFVGPNDEAQQFRRDLSVSSPRQSVHVVPLDHGTPNTESDSGLRLRARLENIFAAEAQNCDTIVVGSRIQDLASDLMSALVELNVMGVQILPIDKFYQHRLHKVCKSIVSEHWLLCGGFSGRQALVTSNVKRGVDIAFVVLASALVLPILGLIALAIKIEGGGPILFCQTRVGIGGSAFKLYKFRTMRTDTSFQDLYTRENDPRITRVGNFLRRFRFDELPQLWNVLRGEMSLIGPRAEWDILVNQYERAIPYYNFRHLVRPGITGMAQVFFRYGASVDDAEQKLEYDLYYVQNYSLLLDFKILLKTVYVVFSSKGL